MWNSLPGHVVESKVFQFEKRLDLWWQNLEFKFDYNRHETEKNQKKRKIATCEGAERPNLLGVGSGGGFPLPQKIVQF